MPFCFFFIYKNDTLVNTDISVENLWDKQELIKQRMAYSEAKMAKHRDEPWTWMNGIRTGLNEKGEQIGPRHDGMIRLQEPDIEKVEYFYEEKL
jgi:hypothetical protein